VIKLESENSSLRNAVLYELLAAYVCHSCRSDFAPLIEFHHEFTNKNEELNFNEFARKMRALRAIRFRQLFSPIGPRISRSRRVRSRNFYVIFMVLLYEIDWYNCGYSI
jgi:hypothetical protein